MRKKAITNKTLVRTKERKTCVTIEKREWKGGPEGEGQEKGGSEGEGQEKEGPEGEGHEKKPDIQRK